MTLTFRDDDLNILNSIRYHIENYQYTIGEVTTTLKQRFNMVTTGNAPQIAISYPQNLWKVKPPHLAIDFVTSGGRVSWMWNLNIKRSPVIIYGFCGGLEGGEANKKQMLQIKSNLHDIFDQPKGGQNVIDLYDFSTGSSGSRTKLDSLEISEVRSRLINAGADDTLEVSKYRFAVEFTVGLLKSQ